MPTLRFRRFDEIPPEDREHIAFLGAHARAAGAGLTTTCQEPCANYHEDRGASHKQRATLGPDRTEHPEQSSRC